MKKTLLTTCIALALLSSTPGAFAAEKINIGEPSWVGAKSIANLIAVVVEDRIGGEATLVPGNNAAIFQAMDAGNGDIDVHPDVWLPNQESFTKKYVDGANTVELSKNSYEGKQSFCVTRAFSEKHNVKSIFDLARPEIAKLMDSDGNGKGEVWVGAPGWASANVNEVKVRDYGLTPFIDAVRAEQSVMQATVGDSIAKGTGYAFYCYSPHAIWVLHDIVRLEEPAHNPEKYKMIQPDADPDWFANSYVASEDALKNVQVAYSKSLKGRSPVIYDFLQNMSLTSEDVSYFAYQIAGKKRDASEVVREWIGENSDRVDSWLGL
ncbi:MAG: glycine/betaine ABC transporter substrate-binding protein [Proteobacteria bacterium]|nr:glycine/betaine ABC transporter substrate-binding protein [Pseudomonadota bacterium]MCH9758920.1 glycine/betaine ABC transporter substrate-binding protein [Pseudomonadota bacterium]